MAQYVKTLATKPDNFNQIYGGIYVMGGENCLQRVLPDLHTCSPSTHQLIKQPVS